MELSSFIWFLLIGFVAGWLAGLIMRGGGFGLLGNIIVGIIGAIIGGWLFPLIGITTFGIIGALITALAGSIVLLFVVRVITGSQS